MQHYILGIDIGTGSTKAVAMGLDGAILSVSQNHYPINQPEPGFSEQDPELIWQAFVQCIKQVVVKLNTPPAAISLSSAMHSLIFVNAEGKALNPMITWADVRSEAIAERIKTSPQGEAIYNVMGTPIHPMSPLCKLIWLQENRADLFNATHKFISIKEYIWHKLFNCFEVDYSIASATGLFDIVNLRWSAQACALAGITADRLSIPVDTGYIRSAIDPAVAELLNIPTNTPFVIGASDGCCANLGSHVTRAGTAALTIGTSGAVRITGNAPVYNYAGLTFNYLLNRNTYVSGGAVNNGGIAVDWLLKNFLNKTKPDTTDYQSLFQTIQSISATSDGLIFLPYLYGERAPIWDAKSSGAYLNIQPQHTQAHFLRAGLEGICYALYDVMQGLEQASGNIEQINISGGFITSPVWVQLLADITGKKLVILQLEDASAMGAIYLGIQALFPQHTLPQLNAAQVIYPDNETHQRYVKMFTLFKQLYADLKLSMHALHQLNS